MTSHMTCPAKAETWPLAAGRWPLAAGRWPLFLGVLRAACCRAPCPAGRYLRRPISDIRYVPKYAYGL
jgi:hypothetical protein